MKKRKKLAFIMAALLMMCFTSCGDKEKIKNESKIESSNTSKLPNANNYTIEEEKISEIDNCSVGDCILLGKYEQNNNLADGSEEIKWIVLEKKDNKILVVSKYGLDCQPYHNDREGASWEACSIKKWLNSVFFNVAFSESEAEMISKVLISEEEKLEYDTQPEEENKLFLLSIEEINKYLGDKSVCLPTKYSLSKGVYILDDITVNGEKACCWWLRSSTENQSGDTNAFAFDDALIHDIGAYVENIAVRPAMWIEIA